MNQPTHYSGHIIKHRFTSLFLDLGILTIEEYMVYQKLLEVADWRKLNPTYGMVKGTMQELGAECFPNNKSLQRKFGRSFKKLLELGLVEKEKPRQWKIPNLHIHLMVKGRKEEFKEYKDCEKNFYKYLKEKIQKQEKKMTESFVFELREILILFLTNEDIWKSYTTPNKGDEGYEP